MSEANGADKNDRLDSALDDMRASVAAFTYDGDRTSPADHVSGEPVRLTSRSASSRE